MLQIDHTYEFLSQNIFNNFDFWFLKNGVVEIDNTSNILVFTSKEISYQKILSYDQEPLVPGICEKYIEAFKYPCGISIQELYETKYSTIISYDDHLVNLSDPNRVYKEPHTLIVSEYSTFVNELATKYNLKLLYYFFHGFAALDWYRGFYALNYNKSAIREYRNDFVSYNRIINNDRSYRIYLISKLAELDLLSKGRVSFNVTDNLFDDWRDEVADTNTKLSEHARQHAERYLTDIDKLVIDKPELGGCASADIPREVDALWNVVTETVFYYDKLHLTEKIFKPIVSKQPFMLLAAPGNLAYLRSYGFKTFDGIIDESYDNIQDHDARIDAVTAQLQWYCNLSAEEKHSVIERLAPIVEHNFHHFYGAFKHIITKELLNNCRNLFKDIGCNDNINYDSIYKTLTS